MNAIAAHLEKLKDYIFILLVTGLYTVVANTFGYNGDIAQGAVGILIIVAIAFFGVVIQMLPGFNKLPVVFCPDKSQPNHFFRTYIRHKPAVYYA